MSEMKAKTGETISVSPMPEGQLAGDIMINTGEDSYPGVILGGGLSGNVVYPGAINDPKDPLPPEINRPLGGLILPPWEIENGLMELLEIKRILKEARDKNLISDEKLEELIAALDDRYRWNDDYMENKEISSDDKMADVQGVVDANLNRIRDYTTIYQSSLDKNKGNIL